MPTATTHLNNQEIDIAKERWSDYQRSHDVSGQVGQTAGIDPATGRIWFGDSILDIAHRRDAEGEYSPLYFVRVGTDYYYRKGGRR